ncbi:MAG: hypothetical protein QXD03_04405 [Candidatus Anstonellales archaeon]
MGIFIVLPGSLLMYLLIYLLNRRKNPVINNDKKVDTDDKK